MSKIEDGGPAFPTAEANYEQKYASDGLSLRDYFAAKAMQAIAGTGQGLRESPMYVAECAYVMADAMLSARTPGAAS